ncbi:metallophosphoesterase family protein [Anaeromicropila populeti]|uniref:DNA repair exonuclease SbcCD nuclease subunit n=1 Tax=Anaeromicropila populeti TaxID=37658 RepID=A0A1I6IYX0_9FIRM|nr:DNA repair exonuclease [Anaeromicropila populeti]SFR71440.1 DNA repair exonuclease SbcCD nuclease subunit [Anaeromicropila populeti]
MKFIHIADIHYGMMPDAGKPWSENRKKEILQSFYEVLAVCNREKADLLLIAGDLFHRQPLKKELKEVEYGFSKLRNTQVVLMAGNHDYIGQNSYYTQYEWKENVKILQGGEMQSLSFPHFSTTVYGFSYDKRDIIEPRYDSLYAERENEINILLAHGGDEKNIPINVRKLNASNFDYIALGHIHKPQLISNKMAYCGSLEPLDINETGPHGYIMGEIIKEGTKASVNIRFVPCAKREYIHLKVVVEPEMTAFQVYDIIKEEIERNGVNNLYRIILCGFRAIDLEWNFQTIGLLGNIIDVMDETMPNYDFEKLYHENRNNMIGMYIDAIRKSGYADDIADKALYLGLEALKVGE